MIFFSPLCFFLLLLFPYLGTQTSSYAVFYTVLLSLGACKPIFRSLENVFYH